MEPGHGALFTADCAHTFHFNCMATSFKCGNRVCPVCRATWKDIHGFHGPSLVPFSLQPPYNPFSNCPPTNLFSPPTLPGHDRSRDYFQMPEPFVFNDDEPVNNSGSETAASDGCQGIVEIKIYPEFSTVRQSSSEENFAVLIHLKAPVSRLTSRAPVDLVTVLDVSGSMQGTKLELLKRAMGFVIQQLGTSDRLSIVTFESSARRVFPLRCMSESGRREALRAVDSLRADGATYISQGLRTGAKVIHDRRYKNPVCSIMLLSDGHDTCDPAICQFGYSSYGSTISRSSYWSSLPESLGLSTPHGKIPVHSFGFGNDHDAACLNAISETSGGTFSYIEAECTIQDCFAQCIGGLLSVVVQQMDVQIEAVHPDVRLCAVRSGSYASQISEDRRSGFICVGDLYAEEKRGFLVSVRVPPAGMAEEMSLLRVGSTYVDPVSKETVRLALEQTVVKIQRPVTVTERKTSMEVDREQNRLLAADAMREAKAAADRGALGEAVAIIRNRRRLLSESEAWRAGDRLCMSLDSELREIQDRMADEQRYEASGRAYLLCGVGAHAQQRAPAFGAAYGGTAAPGASYGTVAMACMVQQSRASRQGVPPGP